MRQKFYYIIICCLISLALKSVIIAQEVSNVSFELIGENIHITFTLTPITEDEYEISSVLKRTSDASFQYTPENMTGDIGEGKYAGINRKIIWNVTDQEMKLFDGDDYYFEVTAKKIESSGGIPWYYYVGTAAVGGAVAAVLLGGSDDKSSSTTTTTTSFAPPPGRP